MGRPRKHIENEVVVGNLLEMVEAGVVPRDDLPAMLADAKQAEDAPLIAAILAACAK